MGEATPILAAARCVMTPSGATCLAPPPVALRLFRTGRRCGPLPLSPPVRLPGSRARRTETPARSVPDRKNHSVHCGRPEQRDRIPLGEWNSVHCRRGKSPRGPREWQQCSNTTRVCSRCICRAKVHRRRTWRLSAFERSGDSSGPAAAVSRAGIHFHSDSNAFLSDIVVFERSTDDRRRLQDDGRQHY